MTDDGDDDVSALAADAAALGIAMNADPSVAEDTRAYLREQTELARLQKENLLELNKFELSHLRWRRFNDQMKGAMQIMAVALGALVVVGIGTALWNASEAQGIVVESFTAPPQLAAQGMGGDVVADDITQKITAVNDLANSVSLAHSEADAQDHSRDVKVDIPDTGISLTEVWRYLKLWLGHERHLNGSLRFAGDSKLSLTVSLGGMETFTFTGAPGELDALEQKAAERVFASIDPHNYVLYLNSQNRNAETLAAARHLIDISPNPRVYAEGYGLYADMVRGITGDARRALALATTGLHLDPAATPQHMEVLNSSRWLGHDEEMLKQAREIPHLRQKDNVPAWQVGPGFEYVQELAARTRALETGDFNALAAEPCTAFCAQVEATMQRALAAVRLHDIRGAAQIVAEAKGYGDVFPDDLARVAYYQHAEVADWPAAADAARRLIAALPGYKVDPKYQLQYSNTQAVPQLTVALAASGDLAGAHKAIDGAASDCYPCLRARGVVAMYEKKWSAASDWFARAVNAAPSVPYAYEDWGAMLAAKGDYTGAVAKYAQAVDKGPRFADPLEMWGEALIAKNRSDLALAKFAEADKYAPRWGRLHLKWGEALLWSGNKDEAKKQFAVASHLALAPAEKAELARLH